MERCMAKVKISLRSVHNTEVKLSTGTVVKLAAGKNVVELDQEDYEALVKKLGYKIPQKPAEAPKVENCPKINKHIIEELTERLKNKNKLKTSEEVEDTPVENVEATQTESTEDKPVETTESAEVNSTECSEVAQAETASTEATEDKTVEATEDKPVEATEDKPAENVEDTKKELDYTSMSYNELKAEYKRVTGQSCKLKKAEIIQFLQEHNNAE
jgi:hypothetical protein